MAEVAYLVRARKEHRCEDRPCVSDGIIRRGQDYVRAVAFPGDDANQSDQPWVLRICVSCATRYGRELPPRRRAALSTPENGERA